MLELTDMMQVVGIINTLQYEYKHVKENYKLEIDCQFYLPIQKSSSIETTILKEMKLRKNKLREN